MIVLFFLGLILGAVITGALLGAFNTSRIDKEESLRRQLLDEQNTIRNLRQNLVCERRVAQERIKESMLRYDSLSKKFIVEAEKLQKEITRLNTSTVKELENEAETIYRNSISNSPNN